MEYLLVSGLVLSSILVIVLISKDVERNYDKLIDAWCLIEEVYDSKFEKLQRSLLELESEMNSDTKYKSYLSLLNTNFSTYLESGINRRVLLFNEVNRLVYDLDKDSDVHSSYSVQLKEVLELIKKIDSEIKMKKLTYNRRAVFYNKLLDKRFYKFFAKRNMVEEGLFEFID